jgi:hypothetical protein
MGGDGKTPDRVRLGPLFLAPGFKRSDVLFFFLIHGSLWHLPGSISVIQTYLLTEVLHVRRGGQGRSRAPSSPPSRRTWDFSFRSEICRLVRPKVLDDRQRRTVGAFVGEESPPHLPGAASNVYAWIGHVSGAVLGLLRSWLFDKVGCVGL